MNIKSLFCRILIITFMMLFVFCGQDGNSELDRMEKMARSVIIYRDTYGVAHVYGPTDASVVFGFMYARAEDEFFRIERYYTESLGRLAGFMGEEGLAWDILVKAVETKIVTFRKTHHGLILAIRNGKAIAVKVGRIEEGRLLEHHYAMIKARNLREFKKALDKNVMVNQNVIYADNKGNIYYVYNGLIPRRDPRFDWSKSVDGSNPEAEWHEYHSLKERPQVLNPESGFVQNCNSSPFTSTLSENPNQSDFLNYMVSVKDQDNLRAKMARRLLSSKEKFTFEEFSRLQFDTYILAAEKNLPELIENWKKLKKSDNARAKSIEPVISELSSWNMRSSVNSVPTTIFLLWFEKIFRREKKTDKHEWLRIEKLEEVIKDLKRDWGTWLVAWGDINRHQRRDLRIDESFSDEKMSLPFESTYFCPSLNICFRRAI